MAGTIVLEEHIDELHEPTEQEVNEYAEWLGMDLESDQDLLWIARLGLVTSLPAPWKPCQCQDGDDIFYFNFQTGASVWDHPLDSYCRRKYLHELEKKNRPRVVLSLSVVSEDSERVRVKAATMGGNTLIEVAIQDPTQTVKWFLRQLKSSVDSSACVVLILPDGSMLAKKDRKKNLCEALGINVPQVENLQEEEAASDDPGTGYSYDADHSPVVETMLKAASDDPSAWSRRPNRSSVCASLVAHGECLGDGSAMTPLEPNKSSLQNLSVCAESTFDS